MKNTMENIYTDVQPIVISIVIYCLRSLHWLPVHYRIVFKILLLTHRALNGLTPDYIKDLLKYNDSHRTL